MTVKERINNLLHELPDSELPAVEQLLYSLAAHGQTPRAMAANTAERRARVYALAGKYAHAPTSADAFAARKREEVDLDQWRIERSQQPGS